MEYDEKFFPKRVANTMAVRELQEMWCILSIETEQNDHRCIKKLCCLAKNGEELYVEFEGECDERYEEYEEGTPCWQILEK